MDAICFTLDQGFQEFGIAQGGGIVPDQPLTGNKMIILQHDDDKRGRNATRIKAVRDRLVFFFDLFEDAFHIFQVADFHRFNGFHVFLLDLLEDLFPENRIGFWGADADFHRVFTHLQHFDFDIVPDNNTLIFFSR